MTDTLRRLYGKLFNDRFNTPIKSAELTQVLEPFVRFNLLAQGMQALAEDYEAQIAVLKSYTDAQFAFLELMVDQYPNNGGNSAIGVLVSDGTGLIWTVSKGHYKTGKIIAVRSGITKSQGNATGYDELVPLDGTFTITSVLEVDETLLCFYIP